MPKTKISCFAQESSNVQNFNVQSKLMMKNQNLNIRILDFGVSRAEREVVGERSQGGEALPQGQGGALGSENAGMSSVRLVRIQSAEYPRFPK